MKKNITLSFDYSGFNISEIARRYNRYFGTNFSIRYFHYLLDPEDTKHKNPERLAEIKTVIKEYILNAA